MTYTEYKIPPYFYWIFKFNFCVLLICLKPICAQVPTNGLVAWYPLNKDHKDISGNGYHLLDSLDIQQSLLSGVDRFGANTSMLHAANFPGILADASLSGFPALTSDFTISFWMKFNPVPQWFDTTSNTNFFHSLFQFLPFNGVGWQLALNDNSQMALVFENDWILRPFMDETSNFYNYSNVSYPTCNWQNISDLEWMHCSVSFDGNTYRVWLNGHLLSEEFLESNSWNVGYPTIEEIVLAKDSPGAFHFEDYTLQMQDCILHERALSSEEIYQMMQALSVAPMTWDGPQDVAFNCSLSEVPTLSITPIPTVGWVGVSNIAFESASITATRGNDAGQEWLGWGWNLDTISITQLNQGSLHLLGMNEQSDTASISSLSPGETYWVRPFMYRNDTLLWGAEKTFTTPFWGLGEGVTDIDGRQYASIIVEDDEWMLEDLQVTHFSDGTPMDVLECNSSSDCFIYAWNYNSLNGKPTCVRPPQVIGRMLYNLQTINCSNEICPSGWRIPTATDWSELWIALDVESSNFYYYGYSDISSLMVNDDLPYGLSLNNVVLEASLFGNPSTSTNYFFSFSDVGRIGGYWLNNSFFNIENYGYGSGLVTNNYNYADGGWPGYNEYVSMGYSIRCIKKKISDTPVNVFIADIGGCADINACNYACGASNEYYPYYPDNCLFENNSCDDGFAASSNDHIQDCHCKGDFGVTQAEQITDADGHLYNSIQLGSQTWMQSNLRTAHYANGQEITGFSTAGDTGLDSLYGYYYPSSVWTSSENICPVGWRLPINADWDALFAFIRPEAITTNAWEVSEVTKFKDEQNNKWRDLSSNSTRLSILPNGVINDNALVWDESHAYLWSDENNALIWRGYTNTVERTGVQSNQKLGIRCIKDN